MAASSNIPFQCSLQTVPSAYFQSLSAGYMSYDEHELAPGPNTMIMNENTSRKLHPFARRKSKSLWSVINIHVHLSQSNVSHSQTRLILVVIDDNIGDNTVVMCEDLLFNLISDSDSALSLISHIDKPYIYLKSESVDERLLPVKAKKMAISLFQPKHLADSLIDDILQNYFSFSRCLCDGDIFSVPVGKYCRLSNPINNSIDCNTVFFKVCELIGPENELVELVNTSHFVDSSVNIIQLPSQQGFFPFRKIALHFKPDLTLLLSNDNIESTRIQNLVPSCFDNIFEKLCCWLEPFLLSSRNVKNLKLNPSFLLSGPFGCGKSLVLKALSQFLGLSYQRVECVTIGGVLASQVEAKIKTLFTNFSSKTPCLVHLANVEAIFQDADCKEDIRIVSFFEQQLKLLDHQWPVVIVATTNNLKSIISIVNRLFLEKISLNTPNCEERGSIISWLTMLNNSSIDSHVVQAVAAQTSGFVYKDLQALVALAYKVKYKRLMHNSADFNSLILSDFLQILETMHKAYSDSIGAPKVPSVSWKDVGGLEHLKKEILRSLRSNMFSTGLKRSGLLLHGPPGTGKTLLAKAVATECACNFLSVKGPELLNMYVGQSEQNVRDLFELAKAASPCIIFFDELDSLAPNRGRSGDSGGVMDRVVSQLLAEMDDLSSSGDVFILGATNRPDLIDPALLRPGRLDKLLYVGPCEDRDSQLGVITALSNKLRLSEDVNLRELVAALPVSVTGAQLSALCSSAWMLSARQHIISEQYKSQPTVFVSREHFFSALSSVFS